MQANDLEGLTGSVDGWVKLMPCIFHFPYSRNINLCCLTDSFNEKSTYSEMTSQLGLEIQSV